MARGLLRGRQDLDWGLTATIYAPVTLLDPSNTTPPLVLQVHLDIRARPSRNAISEAHNLFVIEAVLDAVHEIGDHFNSLLVARRTNEDAAVETTKQGNVDIIWQEYNSTPEAKGTGVMLVHGTDVAHVPRCGGRDNRVHDT